MTDLTKTVIDFLHKNPQWLQEHSAEFGLVPQNNKVLSFQQGKVAQLKKKTEHMAAQLMQILTDAQINREIVNKILKMDKRLLMVNTVTQWYKAISSGLNEDFKLPNHAVSIVADIPKNIRVPKDLIAQKSIQDLVKTLSNTQCGSQIPEGFLTLLTYTNRLESFLQLPLYFNNQIIAVVIIGHPDADYFNSDLATDLITTMADNMSVSLARLLRLER